ncbi:MAG: hypothetical protein HYV07_06730 [Deltaproteobacteria bacterium]|nr:hypothetical protein [Deltaproteobacteria bacterium]
MLAAFSANSRTELTCAALALALTMSCRELSSLAIPPDTLWVVAAVVEGEEVTRVDARSPAELSPGVQDGQHLVTFALTEEQVQWQGSEPPRIRATNRAASRQESSCGGCLRPALAAPWLVGPGESCRVPWFIDAQVDGALAESVAEVHAATVARTQLRVEFDGECPATYPPYAANLDEREIAAIWPPDFEGSFARGFSDSGSVLDSGPSSMRYKGSDEVLRLPPLAGAQDVVALGGERFLLPVWDYRLDELWSLFMFTPERGIEQLRGVPTVKRAELERSRATDSRFRVFGLQHNPFATEQLALGCDVRQTQVECKPLFSPSVEAAVIERRAGVDANGLLLVAGEGSDEHTKVISLAVGIEGAPASFVQATLTIPDIPVVDDVGVFGAVRFRDEVIVAFKAERPPPTWRSVGIARRTLDASLDPRTEPSESRRAAALGTGWRVTTAVADRPGFCATFHLEDDGQVRIACENGESILLGDTAGPWTSTGQSLSIPLTIRRISQSGAERFAETGGGIELRRRPDGAYSQLLGPSSHSDEPLVVLARPEGGFTGFTSSSRVDFDVDGRTSSAAFAGVGNARAACARGSDLFILGGIGGGGFVAKAAASSAEILLEIPVGTFHRCSGDLALTTTGEAWDLSVSPPRIVMIRWDDPRTPEPEKPPAQGFWTPLSAIDAGSDFAFAVGNEDVVVRFSKQRDGWVGDALRPQLPGLVRGADWLSAVRALSPRAALVATRGAETDGEAGAIWNLSIVDDEHGPEAVATPLSRSENPVPKPQTTVTLGTPAFLLGEPDALVVGANDNWMMTVRALGTSSRWTAERSIVSAAYDPVSRSILFGTELGGAVLVR